MSLVWHAGVTKKKVAMRSGQHALCSCRRPQRSDDREVLHGVGADGVRVKFPISAGNCSRFPLSSERIMGRRSKTAKNEEKQRKKKESEEKQKIKKWENSCDPIYTNPIQNLPR